jgi:hypothetical protein
VNIAEKNSVILILLHLFPTSLFFQFFMIDFPHVALKKSTFSLTQLSDRLLFQNFLSFRTLLQVINVPKYVKILLPNLFMLGLVNVCSNFKGETNKS